MFQVPTIKAARIMTRASVLVSVRPDKLADLILVDGTNTYGNILWLFGKFDRPLYRRPMYGTVRYASLQKSASKKFDTAAF